MTEQASRPRRKSPGRRKSDQRETAAAAYSMVVAELARRALVQTDVSAVMDDASSLVSERLGTEYVKVLELVLGGEGFLLTAGIGWQPGYVGQVVVPLTDESQAGYTLHHGVAIVVEDLLTETRFKGMPILHEHGIRSGISVVLNGNTRVHGIMTAHTAAPRKFTQDDVAFLESVAAIVAAVMDKREVEEALRASDERLRLAMDAGGMGTWEWNPHNGEVIWSETLERVHGLAPGTFPGTYSAFFEMVHPEDQERVQRAITQSLSDGVYELEYRALLGDGSVRWLSARGVLIRDARGEPARMIGVCMDVTDRKLLVAELQAAQGRANSLLSNVPGVVWEAWGKPDSSTQRIDFVSDYVEQMLGYTVEEWTSTPNFWLTIVHPDDREKAAASAAATFEAGFGINEFRWVAKDGSVIWVEAQSTVIRDDDGNPVGMRGVTMDITERRQTEARIRESEEAERTARGLADASVNRQAFLSEASAILSSSLDYEVTMASLANLCVPFLADWCAVDVLDDSGVRRVAVVHSDSAKLEFADQLRQRYPPDMDSLEVRQVLSGHPLYLPEITDELMKRSARDDEHLEIIRKLGLRSALSVALQASGRTVGILDAGDGGVRPYVHGI